MTDHNFSEVHEKGTHCKLFKIRPCSHHIIWHQQSFHIACYAALKTVSFTKKACDKHSLKLPSFCCHLYFAHINSQTGKRSNFHLSLHCFLFLFILFMFCFVFFFFFFYQLYFNFQWIFSEFFFFQVLFLFCIFGYLVILIFYKWIAINVNSTNVRVS